MTRAAGGKVDSETRGKCRAPVGRRRVSPGMTARPFLSLPSGVNVLPPQSRRGSHEGHATTMHHWSFLYQYGIGGIIFGVGTYLSVRSGSIDLSSRSGRRSLALMIGGFTLYALVHAASVFLVPKA